MTNTTRRGLFGLLAGASALALAPKVFAKNVPWVRSHAYTIPNSYIVTRADLEDGLFEAVNGRINGTARFTFNEHDWRGTFGTPGL